MLFWYSSSRHNQSRYFRKALPLYDVVFTTKSYNVRELEELSARRVLFVDNAYDPAVHRPLELDEQAKKLLAGEINAAVEGMLAEGVRDIPMSLT